MGRFKKILFVILLVLFWLPMLQQISKVFIETELKGAYTKPLEPSLNIDSIKTGIFQKRIEDYQNFYMGFRADFIKIKNSAEYLLFKKLNAPDIIEGKNGYIYSISSIDFATGKYSSGEESIISKVEKIKFLQQAVEENGGIFLTIFSPSKEAVYPEFLPNNYNYVYGDKTNFSTYKTEYIKQQIPFIDFCSYFRKIKSKTKYPLFSKTGFHWSVYGASIAHDTIINYIKRKLNYNMPGYITSEPLECDSAFESDIDFEGPMNLLFQLDKGPFICPQLKMDNLSLNNKQPKIIIIGDSFFWQLKNLKMFHRIFSDDSKFWYYFANTSFPLGDIAGEPLKSLAIIKEIDSADIVLLTGSIGTLSEFPFGISDYYISHSDKKSYFLFSDFYTKNYSLHNASVNESKKIWKTKKQIHLKANNGFFVCTDEGLNNIIVADKKAPSLWETFSIIPLNKNKALLLSHNNYFLGINNVSQLIVSNNSKINENNIFNIVYLNDTTVAIQSVNNKYLSVENASGRIYGTADIISEKEIFEIKK